MDGRMDRMSCYGWEDTHTYGPIDECEDGWMAWMDATGLVEG